MKNEQIYNAIDRACRGDYQWGCATNFESWSGAGLKGKAKSYSYQYTISRNNLYDRLIKVLKPFNSRPTVYVGKNGKRLLAFVIDNNVYTIDKYNRGEFIAIERNSYYAA